MIIGALMPLRLAHAETCLPAIVDRLDAMDGALRSRRVSCRPSDGASNRYADICLPKLLTAMGLGGESG